MSRLLIVGILLSVAVRRQGGGFFIHALHDPMATRKSAARHTSTSNQQPATGNNRTFCQDGSRHVP
jgi:hypothetical protein